MSNNPEKDAVRAEVLEILGLCKRQRVSKRWVTYLCFVVLWFAGAVTSLVGAIVNNRPAEDFGTAIAHFALVVLVAFLMNAPAMYKAKR